MIKAVGRWQISWNAWHTWTGVRIKFISRSKRATEASGRSWPGEVGSIPGGCHALRASAHKFSQFQDLASLRSNTLTSFFVESECLLIKCFPLCLSMFTANSTPCSTFNQGVNMGLFCEKKAWQHKHKQYQAWHWIQCWLHQTILQLLFYFFETHLPAIANSLFYSSIYQPWHSGHDANILVQCSMFSLHTFTTGSDIAGLLSIQREGEAGKEHLWRWMLQLMTAVTHLHSDLFDSVRFECTLANSALPLEVSADTADCCLFAIW